MTSERIARPGQRLRPGQKSESKYAPSAAARAIDFDKSRDRLFAYIGAFTRRLTDKTLKDNLSLEEQEKIHALPTQIVEAAKDLNTKNVGEGSEVLLATLLHSIISLKDQLAKLEYQNFYLLEELKKVQKNGTHPEPGK